MANPDHLQIAKSGAIGIAQWRASGEADAILDLSDSDLSGMRFHRADLTRVSFRNSNLTGGSVFNCDGAFADFSGACLLSASLALSKFPSANFGQADLTKADLTSADLTVACFIDTNLAGARLTRAHFERNQLKGANFDSALADGTFFLNLDLSEVHGLDKIRSYAPSTVGTDTLYRSKGRISNDFLRKCGLSNSLIEYVNLMTNKPIELNSCFISYTEADDGVSGRLYRDLKKAGARCWRWRDDATWGSTLMKEVDENIREYDKLVVILSEHSLRSEPVIREIERALQKEARQRKEVLFPIRVDDSIFSWNHELQPDVLRKVVGDFSRWEEARNYRKSLDRLIKGLQA